MMSGPRSQREYTITWVSLRSGMASRGMVFMDHTPAAAANNMSMNTANLLRAENSIIRLIMSVSPASRGHRVFQLGFGIDQKCARRHHALTGFEPAQNLNSVADPIS